MSQKQKDIAMNGLIVLFICCGIASVIGVSTHMARAKARDEMQHL